MNLTICEAKKLELIKSEITTLKSIIGSYDRYLEFTREMQTFFLNRCHDLEEADRESIDAEIKSIERFKSNYEARIAMLRDVAMKMGEKRYRLYDSNCRVHRFPYGA